MKKQKIQLIVLVLILAALVGAFFGLRKYNEAQAQKPAEEEGIVVFDVKSDDIINIIYDFEGVTYQYEKVDGTWYLAEDHSQTVKPYYLNAMAMGTADLRATQALEDVTDLSQYGLDVPQRTIIFDTAVQRFRINVGDKNLTTESYYIQVPDQPGIVYIVPQTYMDRFDRGPEDIIEVPEEGSGDTGSGTDTEAEGDKGTGADTDTEGDTGSGADTNTEEDKETGTAADTEGNSGTE